MYHGRYAILSMTISSVQLQGCTFSLPLSVSGMRVKIVHWRVQVYFKSRRLKKSFINNIWTQALYKYLIFVGGMFLLCYFYMFSFSYS